MSLVEEETKPDVDTEEFYDAAGDMQPAHAQEYAAVPPHPASLPPSVAPSSQEGDNVEADVFYSLDDMHPELYAPLPCKWHTRLSWVWARSLLTVGCT